MKIFSLKMGKREQFEFYARYARLKSLLYINRFNRLASNGGGEGGNFSLRLYNTIFIYFKIP